MPIDPQQHDDIPPKGDVWQEWDWAQSAVLSRGYSEGFDLVFAMKVIGVWALTTTLFVDMKLMIGSISDGLPPLRFLMILFGALFPLTVIAGWVVDSQLSLRTPRDRDRPVWLRSLRFLVACIAPLSPIVTPQLWKELLARNPAWSAPKLRGYFQLDLQSKSEDLPFPRRPFLESFYRSWLFRLLTITGTFWGLVGIGVLLHLEGQTADRMTLAVSALTHVLALVCSGAMLDAVKGRGSRWSQAADFSRFLLLLPTPFSLLALTPLLLPVTPRRLLVDSASADLPQARRLFRWRGLEQNLREEPNRLSWTDYLKLLGNEEPREDAGRVFTQRGALFRLKTLFLIPEAGLLSWFAARHLSLFGTDDKTLIPLLIGAFALAFVAILLQAVPPLARGLRWERASELLAPYLIGGYLLLPAAAFLIGWAGGLMVAGNRLQDLVLFLDVTTRMGTLLLLIYGIFRFRDNRFDFGILLAWGLLIPILFTVLVRLGIKSENASLGPWIASTGPCFGILSGIFLGGALLHPFSWSHLRAPKVPLRTQIVLAALALTAVLPLGGLAIPFWIWSRQRLWLWYQREILADSE